MPLASDTQPAESVIKAVWPKLHVLVVGDVMLDKYIWGQVQRISPEAPIPIVKRTRTSEQPGGAANVAMNLAALGAQVTLAGFCGDDAEGISLEKHLEVAKISSAITIVPDRPTTSKARILGGQQQMLRLDVECCEPLPPEVIDAFVARILGLLDGRGRTEGVSPFSAVILSDYSKYALPLPVCRAVISRAKELQIPVVVDPKGIDYTRYSGATTLCPNLAEVALATDTRTAAFEEVLAAAEQMILPLGLDFLTITLSERGIVVLDGEKRQQIPAQAKQVFDVSGAGDTVTAVVALCLASGIESGTAMHIANLAAGIVVGKIGTAPVHRAELLEAMAVPSVPRKQCSLAELAHRVADWKAAGERVVFTNGCFDILHAGHLHLLEEARRQGNRLIVGLNNDQSVGLLKGASRPVNNESHRASMLAAMSAVDAVVIFPDPTPLALIVCLEPDVLVKGSDYHACDIVGSAEVNAYGGEVVRVSMLPGLSTTALLRERMAIQSA